MSGTFPPGGAGDFPDGGGADRPSDSAEVGGVDADGAGPAFVLTWNENGVARSATSAVANRFISADTDFLGIIAADVPAGATLSLVISTSAALGQTGG